MRISFVSDISKLNNTAEFWCHKLLSQIFR